MTLPTAAKTIRVGAYHNPPLIFQDEKGVVDGLYPRILAFIAQKEGWTLEYRFDTFAQHLENLKKESIDLFPAIAYSPERAQMFDFNQETVWLNWGVIYTHPSVSIQSFLDLNGKRIFVVSGDIYYQALREIVTGFALDCQFVEVEDFETVLQKVREEPQSLGVVNRLAGEQFGERYNLKVSPLVFSPVSLRFAVSKGKNEEILQALDRWLPLLKKDPQSVYHWAIRELIGHYTPWHPPRWLYALFLTFGGLVVALLAFNHFLRLQVQRRTRELSEANKALQEEINRHRETEAKLALRLELEETLGRISVQFLSGISLEELVELALSQIGTFLQSDYLLARLPGGEYSFTNPSSQTPRPRLPELLQHSQFRETWERERWLLVTMEQPLSGTLFAFPIRCNEEGEGFVEGVFRKDSPEERAAYLPIIIQYLGALLEYVWAVKRQREKDQWFRVTLQSLGDAVITTNAEGRVTFLNPTAEALTGWSLEEAIGKPVENVFTIVSEKTKKPVESPVHLVLHSGKVMGLANQTLLIRRNGEMIAIDDSSAPIFDEAGKICGVVLVFRDITERRRLEAQIEESERTYRLLFNSMLDGFALLERVDLEKGVDYRILEANPSLKKLLFRFGQLEGKLVSEILPNGREWILALPTANSPEAPPQKREVVLPEFDAFWEVSSFAISPERVGVIIADITLRKKAEEKIRYFTFHDSLTGLYNRLFAEEELKRLDDNRYLPLSILFADLNGLKFLNDAFGHEKGDIMLQKAAQILQASCRESDIIARFGGDEFLIILPHTPFPSVNEIAGRIQKLCKKAQQEEALFLCLALGTATKTEPSQDLWEILNEAEKRAYEQKLEERKRYQGEALLQLLERALFQYGIENEEELRILETMAVSLGEQIGIPKETIPRIQLLARFHDVGKLTLPPEIIGKKEPLTPEEWTILKTHPVAGYRIARTVPSLMPIAEEIYALREHWDGTGYPLGKRGEEIPLLARLVRVVSAYLALSFPRPYRSKPFTPSEALAVIQKEAGLKFDPQMVAAFVTMLAQGSGFPSVHPQE